ncbi:hypothetical protein VP1G_00304 [Cytospora mali]|uniref:Uncharacterized protein n=1 Tax=Cytospora mali TaxID=578113 RepID=A0A194ULX0_CYTMA|nr:hypothetical protein VP1G_00304 [Valsa mali var. pyri (nom. inval.)]
MSGEKGLGSSRWAPINTGRPPYYWSSNKFKNSATTVTSTATSTHTTNINAHAPPRPPSTTNQTSIATTSGTKAAESYQNNNPPSDTSPYQVDVSALNRIPTPWAELTRFMKIARRMRWKLPFLAHGYRAATDRANEDREEAELMFKLDFFEYYMLLERALVHLMGVFGVKVTGALGGARANGSQQAPPNTSGPWAQQSNHRFHANVLEALDDPRNPLHEVLGRDDVRYALARAKELRNRWKNADDPDAVAPAVAKLQASRPLEDYDLERILETIFNGFEGAYGVADRYVADVRALAAAKGVASEVDMRSDPTDEAQWEFMVDAMDWEAV